MITWKYSGSEKMSTVRLLLVWMGGTRHCSLSSTSTSIGLSSSPTWVTHTPHISPLGSLTFYTQIGDKSPNICFCIV